MSHKLNDAVARIKSLNDAIDGLEAELTAALKWRSVALSFGESWASNGPDGYYDMTPEQWLEWATTEMHLKESAEWDRAD